MLKKLIFSTLLSTVAGIASVSQPSFIILSAPKHELKVSSILIVVLLLLFSIVVTSILKKLEQYFLILINFDPPPTKKNFAPTFEFSPTKSICFLIKFRISSNRAEMISLINLDEIFLNLVSEK